MDRLLKLLINAARKTPAQLVDLPARVNGKNMPKVAAVTP